MSLINKFINIANIEIKTRTMAKNDGKINPLRGIRITDTLKAMDVGCVLYLSSTQVSKEVVRSTCSRFKQKYGNLYVVNNDQNDRLKFKVTRLS